MRIPGGGASLYLLGLTLLALSLSPFFLNCAVFLLEDLKQRRKGKTVTILGENDQEKLILNSGHNVKGCQRSDPNPQYKNIQ